MGEKGNGVGEVEGGGGIRQVRQIAKSIFGNQLWKTFQELPPLDTL